jgi:hypothetical protein
MAGAGRLPLLFSISTSLKEITMPDIITIATGAFAAVAAAPNMTAAAEALRPIEASLRATLTAPRPAAASPPVMRLMELRPLTGHEGAAAAAERLRLRLDEVELARRHGDAADVARVVNGVVAELRTAAIGSRRW